MALVAPNIRYCCVHWEQKYVALDRMKVEHIMVESAGSILQLHSSFRNTLIYSHVANTAV